MAGYTYPKTEGWITSYSHSVLDDHLRTSRCHVGTNSGMAQLAGEAERWLEKPVIAINTALYWQALRQNGIDDKIPGWGRLLVDF